MTPAERDAAYLWDMQQAAREVLAFTSGLTADDFATDPKTQRAVERSLEIVGEAARKVSRELEAAHPEIPWQAIVAHRHVLAHPEGSEPPTLGSEDRPGARNHAGLRPRGGQNRGHLGAPDRVSTHENDPVALARRLLEQAAKLGNPPAMLEAARQLLGQAVKPPMPLRIAERG